MCFEAIGSELDSIEIAGSGLVSRMSVDVDDPDSTVARAFRAEQRLFEPSGGHVGGTEFRQAESLLAAPVIRGVDRLGVLVWLWRRARRSLSDYEDGLVDVLIAEKGVAVENSHLLSRRDDRRHLRLFRLAPAPAEDRPLVELGLREGLAALVQETRERPGGMQVEIAAALPSATTGLDLRPSVMETAFFVIREALHNATVHSGARHVDVEVGVQPDRLTVAVQDDGRGFDAGAAVEDRSGLDAMRTRAELVGGELDVRSAPGDGASVRLTVTRPRSADVLEHGEIPVRVRRAPDRTPARSTSSRSS